MNEQTLICGCGKIFNEYKLDAKGTTHYKCYKCGKEYEVISK
jgi:transposase-like protein